MQERGTRIELEQPKLKIWQIIVIACFVAEIFTLLSSTVFLYLYSVPFSSKEATTLYYAGIFDAFIVTILTAPIVLYFKSIYDEKLKLINKNLSETIVELKYARDKAVEGEEKSLAASKAKSVFLAHMNHELRTPLQAVIGYSQILLKKAEKDSNKEYKDALEHIYTSGKHQLHIVDELLTLAKIEGGTITLNNQAIELDRLIDNVVKTAEITFSNDNRLSVVNEEESILMNVDPVRLKQIILNLLTNADKFTNKGQITLHVKAVHHDKQKMVEITVADNGIGMTEEQQQKIFNEFYQVDNSRIKQRQGAGLGLAISRYFCHAMGGRITVDSMINFGTAFRVTLPVGNIDSIGGSCQDNKPALVESLPSANILLAEDNTVSMALFSSQLREYNQNIIESTDGQSALHALLHETIDVALLDLHMPVMDGLEVVKTYQEQIMDKPIPIAIFTADISIDIQNECQKLGIKLIKKPIEVEDLLQQIANMLDVDSNSIHPEQSEATYSADQAFDEGAVATLNRTIGEIDVQRLIHKYIEAAEEAVAAIIQNLSVGNILEIRKKIHILKGSSGQIGANLMYHQLNTIYKLEDTEIMDNSPALISQLQKVLQITRQSALSKFGLNK